MIAFFAAILVIILVVWLALALDRADIRRTDRRRRKQEH
jgi:ABC-type spermidine/putrescine transport system permease subunit II